jgi:SAM-dependent methyltransferase
MRTDSQWESWAKRDPYFAVLAANEYRGDLSPETRTAFFASGDEHIAKTFDIIRRHLAPGFAPRSALDFGCGVGRNTIPLARICRTVGIDVSPTMLELARRNAAEFGANATFAHEPDGHFDLVHSVITFQHIPVDRGLELARRLLDHLNAGGIAALHFTCGNTKGSLVRAVNWVRYRIAPVQWATNVLRGRPLLEPPTQMNSYELASLLELFAGFTLYCEPLHAGGYLGYMIYGRKDRAS